MLCDLHLHTSKSDGTFAPARLYDEIRGRGLRYFSITDHDCLDAYPVPDDLRDRVIPGIEVDSQHEGQTVHILAYGISDPESPLVQALAVQRLDRHRRMQSMIDRLCAFGINIQMRDVAAQASGATSLGRPHLARALVAQSSATTIQDAFDRFISDDGPGYAPLNRLASAEILALIHSSGGVAIVAHPMRLRAFKHLDELIALGLDGIEVVHPTATPQDEIGLRATARKHALLVTGGTDFHEPVLGHPIGVAMQSTEIDALREAVALG